MQEAARAHARRGSRMSASGSRSKRHPAGPACRRRQSCRRRLADDRARGDPGPRRRIRLRQVDAGEGTPSAQRSDIRPDRVRRAATSRPPPTARCGAIRRRMQMVFQDPYASLNPRHSVGRSSGSRFESTVSGRGSEIETRVQELLELVGLPADAAEPLPARVLGRPAPADRTGACARAKPRVSRLRRARLRTRRLDPGADHQPDRGASAEARAHVPVHRPRPRRRPSHLDAYRGDVPREDRRGRTRRRPLREPASSVHDHALVRDSDPGSRNRAAAQRDSRERRPAQPREPAEGLSFPHAVPVRPADQMRGGRAATA